MGSTHGVAGALSDRSWGDYVGVDNLSGAEMGVEHLIGHGHRRIAMVGGHLRSSAGRDRSQGYRNALARHGLFCDNVMVAHAGRAL